MNDIGLLKYIPALIGIIAWIYVVDQGIKYWWGLK